MFEVEKNPKLAQRALLIGIHRPGMGAGEANELLKELHELVDTLEIPVIDTRLVNLREPNPGMLVGSGKAKEIMELVREKEIDVVVFDDDLSPAQQRNWEQATKVCVIDRQEVILDIFARRAHTREAMLQVGLARMVYSLPRLKRAWTHLSRQRGGGGTVVRGAGETQLESDRRLVQDRIARLKRELAQVERQRHNQRKRRFKNEIPSAAIVGYTNAGKSSLLNRLTGARVLAEDKLFATLDPTTRQTQLNDGQPLLLTDTVGFLRRLPHDLIDAFHATLEEALVSDFLIHVLDLTNPEVERHHATTLQVLKELGADTKKVITVFNKIDRANDTDTVQIKTMRLLHPDACFVSARTGEGIEDLQRKLEVMVDSNTESCQLLIPHSRHDLISRLHRLGCIRSQISEDEGVFIRGRFPNRIVPEVHPFVVNGNGGADKCSAG